MAMRVQMGCAWGRLCLLLFLLQLPGSQAKCYFQAKAPCEYEGKQFSLGESWLSTNCLLCTCLHPIGVGCCETPSGEGVLCVWRLQMQPSKYQSPVGLQDARPWGMRSRRGRVHRGVEGGGTCQISVVQKANPSLPCVKSMEHEWGSAGTPEPLRGAGLSR
ncbi:PREDICTED: prostate-associated microseminoprotein [Merops nubicus]|uniref:prostate-associated microseminoprotein n=1 Tax=Merops nubicus TaxID=57421 RepID=UPI0004F072CD|nr:PREDICTED: prostate-associated microseminoprotein [Merops nubicus]